MLAKLNAGDAAAADQMFRTFEPFLRMVIRRRISGRFRAKFDSSDIVQSVWADVVDGLRQSKWTFENVEQLRAFLVKMTRNRFVDRVRQHRRAVDQEKTMPPQDIAQLAHLGAQRASENLYADELWRQILAACPPDHYDVLLLSARRSLDEIAARTGLHKGSVRRILYQVGRILARHRAAGP